MHFTIEFQVDHLNRALEAVRHAVATPKEVLGAIGLSLHLKNANRHSRGLAPDGTPWKPLAPLTIGGAVWEKQDSKNRKSNSKRGPMMSLQVARSVQTNRRILFKTGEMLGPQFVSQVDGDTLRLGFGINRAAWHHFGTHPYTITPKKAKALSFAGIAVKRVHHPGLPARPLIGFPDEDANAVIEEVEDYLVRALAGARR